MPSAGAGIPTSVTVPVVDLGAGTGTSVAAPGAVCAAGGSVATPLVWPSPTASSRAAKVGRYPA